MSTSYQETTQSPANPDQSPTENTTIMNTSAVETTRNSSVERTGVNSLNDYWLYLRSFFRSGLDVASLLPSSRWTARAMLSGIDFDNCKTILELGAGTGAVTAELLSTVKRRTRTVIVERDPEFYARLKQRFPTAEIIREDALDLPGVMQKYEIGRVDHILSTLPLNWFSPADQERLLKDICQTLRPQGSFRQLTHLPWAHHGVLQQHFTSVSSKMTWRNLPPSCCYICRQPRG